MKHLLPFTLAILMASVAPAQVGSPFPDVELSGFTGSEATSFADYEGRLVLIEFFAHW